MKRKVRKLQLAKETLVNLDDPDLKGPRGGYYTPETYCCPSMTGETQCYCPVITEK